MPIYDIKIISIYQTHIQTNMRFLRRWVCDDSSHPASAGRRDSMQDYNKTTYYTGTESKIAGSIVTIFDGDRAPRMIWLNQFRKDCVCFGRGPQNDIVLTSPLVSTLII